MNKPTTEVVLSDGTKVTLRDKITNREMVDAKRMAKGDEDLLPYAMMSVTLLFNGSPLHLDDILAMELKDTAKITPLIERITEDFQ